MKFFSNEAKENDPGYDRSDVATSDPVAVPQQRAGSPWSDTPGEPAADYREPQHRSDDDTRDDEDAEIAEQELRDDTNSDTDSVPDTNSHTDSDTNSHTDSDTDSHTDSDTDAVSDSDTDAVSDTDSRTDSDVDLDIDEPRDEHVSEPVTTTYGPDGTVTSSDEPVDTDDRVTTEDETDEDRTIKDEGTFDSPEAVEPATGDSLDSLDAEEDNGDKEPEATVEELPADEPDHDLDTDEDRTDALNGSPVAVDPEPVPALDADDRTTFDEGEAVGTVAAVPVAAAATPGSVPEQPLDRLFSDGDSFAERFRDIQLRFVDTPKEATADAAALVGEAVDKITLALNSQKDALGGDSDDTEQLRVQLRGYRDLLNRLTGL
ncbi:hypothetical protein [Actinoplanes sp. NPDC026619]|uniref:hypothetical protein n=1 Tax=Actinoplanes sp. NPDC026619 TaxID=3155798 RepID=UPI0033C5B104